MIHRLLALEHLGVKLGLENIRHLLDALDHPERAFRAIHIAGTNGKGSVTAMVHAALVAAGHRTARYTSPHLSRLSERFVIDHEEVTADLLDAVGHDVLDCAETLVRRGTLQAPPTFFEATTAIGFEIFRRARVEFGVIEVGLGGRFDATNVLEPEVGAITSIGRDHEQYLGTTIAQIAFEKAGIIKTGLRVVTGRLPQEAQAVIDRVAQQRGAVVIGADQDATIESGLDQGAARILVTTPAGRYGPVVLGLRGAHQIDNALVAIRILECLGASGTTIPSQTIEHGLASCVWPARLELIVLTNGQRVLLDAAHNPEGARALGRYLSQWHPERPPLVVGVMADKDATGILEHLLPVAGPIVVTAARTPRALPAQALAELARRLDPARLVLTEPSPHAAVARALELGPTVCVAGSIFLAGEVRDALEGRAILP